MCSDKMVANLRKECRVPAKLADKRNIVPLPRRQEPIIDS
jgi:hypothetical protein